MNNEPSRLILPAPTQWDGQDQSRKSVSIRAMDEATNAVERLRPSNMDGRRHQTPGRLCKNKQREALNECRRSTDARS